MKTSLKIGLLISLSIMTSIAYSQTPVFPPTPQFPPQYAQPYMQPQVYPGAYPPMTQQPPAFNVQKNNIKAQKPFKEFSGYLGIVVDILPSAVTAQLPEGVKQGILIKSFSPDSPAVTTELKPFDVLFAYDNVKINHPAQFIKVVRNDDPGRAVKIKVVRKGNILEIPVTIGSQKTPNPKEFNGLAIKQVGKDKYRAIVRFIGPNGNKQVRSYEGDREGIFEQANNAQDLPQAERQQLLYATRPRQQNSNSGFGSFFPFGGNKSGGNNNWMNPRKYFNW